MVAKAVFAHDGALNALIVDAEDGPYGLPWEGVRFDAAAGTVRAEYSTEEVAALDPLDDTDINDPAFE